MTERRDIFEGQHRTPCSVPEGYFASLQDRLQAIPERDRKVVPLWSKARPYVALAACLAVAVLVGNSFFGRSAQPAGDAEYMQLLSEIPYTDPYSVFQETEDAEEYSQEFLADYIIETCMSAEELEYLLNK